MTFRNLTVASSANTSVVILQLSTGCFVSPYWLLGCISNAVHLKKLNNLNINKYNMLISIMKHFYEVIFYL